MQILELSQILWWHGGVVGFHWEWRWLAQCSDWLSFQHTNLCYYFSVWYNVSAYMLQKKGSVNTLSTHHMMSFQISLQKWVLENLFKPAYQFVLENQYLRARTQCQGICQNMGKDRRVGWSDYCFRMFEFATNVVEERPLATLILGLCLSRGLRRNQ